MKEVSVVIEKWCLPSIKCVTVVLAGWAFGGSLLLAQSALSPSSAPYLNPALPIDQRVDDLISRMTLEE